MTGDRCRRQLVSVLMAVWALAVPGTGQGAGLRELQDSWLVDAEATWELLGNQADPLARLARPQPCLLVDCAQGKLFSQPELPQLAAGLLLRRNVGGRLVSLAGSWQTLGQGVFTESVFAGKIGLGTGPGLAVGLLRTAQTLAGQKDPPVLRLVLEGQHRLRLNEAVLLLARAHLGWDTGRSDEFPAVRRPLLDLVLVGRGTGLAMAIDRRADGAPVVGLDALWRAGPGVGISLRLDASTGAAGPGLELRRGALLLRTSHLVHPALGQTHRFQLGVVRAHG